MLSPSRGLHVFAAHQRDAVWNPSLSPDARADGLWELGGKTLLVVGLGGIGTELAARAHALGMRVIAIRNSGRDGPAFVEYVGLPDELVQLAARADVELVSICGAWAALPADSRRASRRRVAAGHTLTGSSCSS